MKRVSVLAALALVVAAAVPGLAATPARGAHAFVQAAGAGQSRTPIVVQASPAQGLVVLSSTVTEDQEDGTAEIFGEIQNDYDVPVEFIRVDGFAYGPSAKVITQDDSYVSLDPLNPGEKATFDVRLDQTGDTYSVKVTRFEASPFSANRNFTKSESTSTDEFGLVHITGTIRNDNVEPTAVALRVTYYDTKHVAVSDGIALVSNLDDLQPGQTAPYEIVPFSLQPFASFLVVPDGIGSPTTSPSLGGVWHPCAIGEEIRLSGTAKPGEPVTFEKYATGTWFTIAGLMATPDANTGDFAANYTVTGPAWIRAKTISGASAAMSIEVGASISFKSSAPTAKKGATVTLSGSVKPGIAGTVATIQKKSGSRWVTLGTAKLTAAGTFVYKWRATAKGKSVLRVSVPNMGVIYGGQSDSRTVTVK